MNDYIVCGDELKKEFNSKLDSRKYKEITEIFYSSDAIIWNAFAPWKYCTTHQGEQEFIFKLLKKVFSDKTFLENDFLKNEYKFFGRPLYFDYSQPDLVIDNGKNCLILEAKYTEDSNESKVDTCEQISSYLCDIFYKLISSNPELNPYFIVLYPEATGKYYKYYQIIKNCKNNYNEIKLKLIDCIERRKKKNDPKYNMLCFECDKKLSSDECEPLLKKISENIGLLSWEELKELLLESIEENSDIKSCIDDYANYEEFFKNRLDRDFLLRCYACSKSNI